MNVIEIENLSKLFKVKIKDKGFLAGIRSIFSPQYKQITALDNMSLSVQAGDIVGFVGPNGAGKSTAIKIMTSVLFPDRGKIKVLGMNPIKDRKKLLLEIGTVFGQKEQLWAHLTPYDNFMLMGSIYDINKSSLEKRIEKLIAVFDLKDFVNIPIKNLSLGQRIRCEFGASLVHNPKILFLDEPTIGLDVVVKENIRSLIKSLNETFGITVFLTSHDISDIEKLSNRIVIINKGKIVLNTLLQELKNSHLNKKIVEIRLKEKVNFLRNADVLENTEHILKVRVNVNKTNIADIVNEIDSDKIIDINIFNIPLEEIISNIYKDLK